MPPVAVPPAAESAAPEAGVESAKYTPMAMVQPLVEGGMTEVPARFIQPEDLRAGRSVGNSQIPVIDMSLLDGERRDEVLAQMAAACEEWGFFQV